MGFASLCGRIGGMAAPYIVVSINKLLSIIVPPAWGHCQPQNDISLNFEVQA